ncbi:Uncharacterised protein [Mycobacteroides abscessus]|nr:Uncharacterised protein [Mycobacteroides abscessus]
MRNAPRSRRRSGSPLSRRLGAPRRRTSRGPSPGPGASRGPRTPGRGPPRHHLRARRAAALPRGAPVTPHRSIRPTARSPRQDGRAGRTSRCLRPTRRRPRTLQATRYWSNQQRSGPRTSCIRVNVSRVHEDRRRRRRSRRSSASDFRSMTSPDSVSTLKDERPVRRPRTGAGLSRKYARATCTYFFMVRRMSSSVTSSSNWSIE